MDEIRKQVQLARRRLIAQQFLGYLPWTLFLCLLAAVIAIAVPKIWVLDFLQEPAAQQSWWISWLGGAAAVGLLLAAGLTWWKRRTSLDAAIEVDHRCGLSERVASTLSLGQQEMESEAGRALLSDTSRQVERLDLREHFRVSLRPAALLPLLPAAAAFIVAFFLQNAISEEAKAARENQVAVNKRIKESAKELKKRVETQRKEAQAKGLKDAEALFKEIQEGLDHLNKPGEVDRKEAMVNLNNLKDKIAERKKELGDANELRKQLDNLKEAEKGPAEQLAKALKEGDFNKAMEQIENLEKALKNGDLNEEEQKQLANQLDAVKEKIEQLAAAHEEAKQDLKEQIEQKMQAGDLAGAGDLQQQLDQLNQQNQQMEQLQNLAQQAGEAAEALKQGNGQQAQQQLQQLADQLQDLQQQMDELEMLDQAMNQIADAKNAMNCQQCQGGGCAQCQGDKMNALGQGNGAGQQKDGPPGMGLGEGQGQGARPEEENDTQFYDSRVAGDPQPGEAVRTGDAGGPNVAGKTKEEVKAEIAGSMNQSADPLTNQNLSRSQREHARQYFDAFQPAEKEE